MTTGNGAEEAARANAFDLRRIDAGFLATPYPTYALLRTHDPMHIGPDGSYFLTRYDDVMAVYRDKRFSSDKKAEFGPKFGDSPLYTHHTTSLVFNDPPLHTRVRKLLAPAFTPRALHTLQPRFVSLVDGLLDAAEAKGAMDLIGDFAAALPVEIIGDMLGVPRAERHPLRGWSLAILGALEPSPAPDVLQRGNDAVTAFSCYLDALIDARRKHPRENDVLTSLITGSVDGESLTGTELVQNCIFLLNAGHETTSNLIGNGGCVPAGVSGGTAEADRKSRPDRFRRRGIPALRKFQPVGQPARDRRCRNRRCHHCRRQPDYIVYRCCKSRPRTISRPGTAGYRTQPEPAPCLRCRHSCLRGHDAGAHGRTHCHQQVATTLPEFAGGGRTGSRRQGTLPRLPVLPACAGLRAHFRANCSRSYKARSNASSCAMTRP